MPSLRICSPRLYRCHLQAWHSHTATQPTVTISHHALVTTIKRRHQKFLYTPRLVPSKGEASQPLNGAVLNIAPAQFGFTGQKKAGTRPALI